MNAITELEHLHSELDREAMAAHWMPFTANRQFKSAPRLLVAAEGMYYTSHDGRKVLDMAAGLWCVNAGHNRRPIVEAIQRQAATMDFAPPFNMGHPLAFEVANRLVAIAPEPLRHVMFTNSGSESVDTALKIALAYQRQRGQGTRTRLIGRVRGYHGVNLGGTAVGGIVYNRKFFGALVAGVDHLPSTHLPELNAFSRGQPEHGAHLADELEKLVALHDASTIAAVIVEPIAGSTGVLIPPKGYLERLREICTKHGILLIFDEVITGFGRTGAAFAAQKYGVAPDMITCAKGLTNASVPMGAVLVTREIYEAFMQGPEHLPELPHGYTYSAHPLACAAAQATLELYAREGLFERARAMAPVFEEAVHSLRGTPRVIDIRNDGLVAAVELEPRPGVPGRRAFDVFVECYRRGLMVRATGDTIALSPPLIVEEAHIAQCVDTLRAVIQAVE
ncbi:MAG: aspartate aminotransferase family protein [Casimicrobiaceae bacterium]|nr:aspartate aminotransferase family protein [Casimicrobiaceae bacterium]MCX8098121.1 aspartate aminotransferase family protein [Casimicrobiaceae bacterium]